MNFLTAYAWGNLSALVGIAALIHQANKSGMLLKHMPMNYAEMGGLALLLGNFIALLISSRL